MTQKLRTQYIAAFRDMQAATLTLGSTAGTIATTADIAGEATALAIALG